MEDSKKNRARVIPEGKRGETQSVGQSCFTQAPGSCFVGPRNLGVCCMNHRFSPRGLAL